MGGKSKLPLIVGGIIFTVIVITVLPMLHVSSDLHSDADRASLAVPTTISEDAMEVYPGEFEPIVDPSLMDASENPTLAAAATCRMLDIIHRRSAANAAAAENKNKNNNNGNAASAVSFWTPEYAKLASADTPFKNSADLFANRIKRWHDPRGAKVADYVARSGNNAAAAAGGGGNGNKNGGGSGVGSGSTPPTIFCMMYTEGGDAAKNMKDTWLSRCDDYLVVSRFANPPPGIDKSKYHEVHVVLDTKPDSMYPRLSQTLHMLALSKAKLFDYFVYTTDDSHVVVENLRMAVNDPSIDALHRMGAPLFMGHRMVTTDDAPFISNAMMVMNTYLLKLMVTILPDTRCFVTHQGGSEDLFLSKCMLAFRIFPLSVEDIFGHERIHVLGPDGVASGGGGGWYADYHRGFNPPKGNIAFSVSTIHIHSVGVNDHANIQKLIA